MELGVYSLLACGYNAQSNEAVLGLRQSIPGLPIAIGLHPWFADEAIDTVAELIARAAPNAVGECGLDAAANDRMPSGAVQRKAFEIQLASCVSNRIAGNSAFKARSGRCIRYGSKLS